MRLDSVLSLKAELSREFVITGRAASRAVARAFTASKGRIALARSLDVVHTRSPESNRVAFGVAAGRKSGDFRLGARVQVGGNAGRRLAASIREKARGEADVRITPDVRKRKPSPSWFRKRRRPLEAGVSCGHFKITAGTLGFVVEDDDAYYVLSNNHVLADVNAGEPGDPIVQPGPVDQSGRKKVSDRTLIGVLDRFVPISFQRSNVVDCAVAEILPELEFYLGWTEALPGRVKGWRPLTVGDIGRPVLKAGRTTGVTRGTITQVRVDRLSVDMGDPPVKRVATFSNQVEIIGDGGKLFSDAGDSGSLIVDERGHARALLFAGGEDEETGEDVTFANPIGQVLGKLGVRLAL